MPSTDRLTVYQIYLAMLEAYLEHCSHLVRSQQLRLPHSSFNHRCQPKTFYRLFQHLLLQKSNSKALIKATSLLREENFQNKTSQTECIKVSPRELLQLLSLSYTAFVQEKVTRDTDQCLKSLNEHQIGSQTSLNFSSSNESLPMHCL